MSFCSKNALATWIAPVPPYLALTALTCFRVNWLLAPKQEWALIGWSQAASCGPLATVPSSGGACDLQRCNWSESPDSCMKCRHKSALSASWMWMRKCERHLLQPYCNHERNQLEDESELQNNWKNITEKLTNSNDRTAPKTGINFLWMFQFYINKFPLFLCPLELRFLSLENEYIQPWVSNL